MARKPIVGIRSLSRFGDRLATNIRKHLSISKQLSGKRGLVRLGKVTTKKGKTNLFIEIGGKNFKDKSGNPINDFIYSLEYGADPHPIFPRKKSLLAFRWPQARPPFFRGQKLAGVGKKGLLFYYVDHPGMAGKGLISMAVDLTLSQASDELATSIAKDTADILEMSFKEITKRKK